MRLPALIREVRTPRAERNALTTVMFDCSPNRINVMPRNLVPVDVVASSHSCPAFLKVTRTRTLYVTIVSHLGAYEQVCRTYTCPVTYITLPAESA